MSLTKKLQHCPRWSLAALIGSDVSEPNIDINAFEMLESADMIFAQDVMSQHYLPVYVREFLEGTANAKTPVWTKMVVIEIDQETDELETLFALITDAKGRHNWSEYAEVFRDKLGRYPITRVNLENPLV